MIFHKTPKNMLGKYWKSEGARLPTFFPIYYPFDVAWSELLTVESKP